MTPDSSTNLLRVQNLRYLEFGPLSFEIAPGEILGVSGRSGCGKSTLLRVLVDLDAHYTADEISLGGIRSQVVPANQWRQKLAFLPANSMWWFPTVGEHFSSPEKVPFEELGFTSKILEWDVTRLSSGEKQRLALLRLLQNAPEGLLLDEPTAHLDAENVAMFENFIVKYIHERKIPCLWVSHHPEQIQRVAQRELCLPEGKCRKILVESAHAHD